MKLSPSSEKLLDAWINGHWNTTSSYDMERWYDFINQLRHDRDYYFDRVSLFELIARKLNLTLPVKDEIIIKIINTRISEASRILEFLKHTEKK